VQVERNWNKRRVRHLTAGGGDDKYTKKEKIEN
jgi:hypothetical protein